VDVGKKKDRKKHVRQVAALAFRRADDGTALVLLMSSLDTHRPVIPKGWPMKGKSDSKAAALEAYQEAGVRGRISKKAIGSYRYWKRRQDHFDLAKVAVFSLEVRKTEDDYPEKGRREFVWLPQADAAAIVDDPELGTLIASAKL
jgi:8-oxo-dGTP pyrophosphatase MutT (NUDIX family)